MSYSFQESRMLAISGGAKIFLCHGSTDLRKGFEGLSALVESGMEQSLTNNAYFIFVNKTRDRMKILYLDIDGLAIWYKRLEKGRFPKRNQKLLDRREFFMLLEGIEPKRLSRRYKE